MKGFIGEEATCRNRRVIEIESACYNKGPRQQIPRYSSLPASEHFLKLRATSIQLWAEVGPGACSRGGSGLPLSSSQLPYPVTVTMEASLRLNSTIK